MTLSKTGRSRSSDEDLQRAYYADTAQKYDEVHVAEDGEHDFALQFMISVLERFGIRSILDIGSGTGRALIKIRDQAPNVSTVGVEPSSELRKIGHSKGLPDTQLIDGDGMNLAFADGSFDLVCEFGALHHIPEPSRAVGEMLRVARKAVFISDSNNFGQGSRVSRLMKQSINAVGLWRLADLIKTKGSGYTISEGDGLAYSYSVFNDYKQISRECKAVHMLNTTDGGPNLYRTASHVALLGIKRQAD
jgi:ubiquinone/menaquinone biosynthesis C-methylase UbiE